jgi:hypothetical protein
MNAKSRTLMLMSLAIGLAACGSSGGSTVVDGERSQALNGGGTGPDRRPPQEAVIACADLGVGQDCAFSVRGKCLAGPDGGVTACVPRPPRPPQEAVTACEGLAADAACTFTLDADVVNGRCRGGGDMPLACGPEGRQLLEPPATAIDACAALAAGDECTFDMAGVCLGPDDRPLACTPPVPFGRDPLPAKS